MHELRRIVSYLGQYRRDAVLGKQFVKSVEERAIGAQIRE